MAVQVLLALGATWFSPYDPMAQSIVARLEGPKAPIGSERINSDATCWRAFSMDIARRCMHASSRFAWRFWSEEPRALAAYYRGWLDRVVMRVMDVLFAFPVMLLAIGVIAVLGPHT